MVSSCNNSAPIGGGGDDSRWRRRRQSRVVIIGAGMAGLSAAYHLLSKNQLDDLEEGGWKKELEVKVVEASDRIGGRIWSSEMGGDRVEMGATWIQGVEGSPVYAMAMAEEQKKKKKKKMPFECQDGFPADPPIVKAEGGQTVDPSVIEPVTALYDKLLAEIRSMEDMGDDEEESAAMRSSSIGSFVTQAFVDDSSFFFFRNNDDDDDDDTPEMIHPSSTKWSPSSLQEAALRAKENMERVDTAADSIFDLDLRGEREYRDYPGEHVTIAAGYSSVVHKLAASLPRHSLHFNKRVTKISWNHHHSSSSSSSAAATSYPVLISCADGSLYEADHVIITVSLGVLKASVLQQNVDDVLHCSSPADESLSYKVCRSIYDSAHIHRISSPIDAAASPVPVFDPPLPPWKALSISKLGYGVVDKLFLRLNPRSLHSSSRSQLTTSHFLFLYHPLIDDNSSHPTIPSKSLIPWWMRRTFSIAPIYKGSSVLLLWFAGADALEMEGLSDVEVMSGVEKTLAEFGVLEQNSKQKPAKGGSKDDRAGVIHGEFEEDDEESRSEEDNNVVDEDEESCGSDVGGGDSPMFSSSTSSSSSMAAAEQSSTVSSDSEQESGYGSGDQVRITSVAAEYGGGGGGTTTNQNKRSAATADDEPLFSQVMRSRWGRDPLYRGSYSYVATGASGEDIDALAAPLPEAAAAAEVASPLQLLFAGEATERQMYSTTHGAYLSGLREATRLLHHLQGQSMSTPQVNGST